MEELERPIAGYDGIYWIRRDGTVISLAGSLPTELSWFIKKGYYHVSLYKDGKRKDHRLHRLVALAWVHNPHPRKWRVVLHKDDDKLNPHADNLKWGSQLHNVRDMVKKGRSRNQHTGRLDK